MKALRIVIIILSFLTFGLTFSQTEISKPLISSNQSEETINTSQDSDPLENSKEVINSPPKQEDVNAPEVKSVMTSFELWLSFGVLIFGFLVMLIELYLMKVNTFDQNQTIKFILVTLIITSALFLITAGFSNNQIAPAMGLLGTVAGYLLGKGDSSGANKNNSNKP